MSPLNLFLGQKIRVQYSEGRIVATPGALDVLQKASVQAASLLARHQSGDFGDLDPSDKELNLEAIAHEGGDKQQRVMSVYKIGTETETIWIITEKDRSVTTLLLPSEY